MRLGSCSKTASGFMKRARASPASPRSMASRYWRTIFRGSVSMDGSSALGFQIAQPYLHNYGCTFKHGGMVDLERLDLGTLALFAGYACMDEVGRELRKRHRG